MTLEQNYRSTQAILVVANAVIAGAAERFTKDSWSDRQSAARPALITVRDETGRVEYVCAEIRAAREAGVALKSRAVLFRTSHHSGPLEVELTRRSIPFAKFGGLKFLDTAHVKDVLAVLRMAENPRDCIAGFRVLLLPGIGPASAEAILDAMGEALEPSMVLPGLAVPARPCASRHATARELPGYGGTRTDARASALRGLRRADRGQPLRRQVLLVGVSAEGISAAATAGGTVVNLAASTMS